MRILLALLLGLLLTACGDTGSDTGSADGADSDAAFTTELMHRDAALLNLLDVGLGRELPGRLVAVSDQLRIETTDRMETAADLLEEWGEEVPKTVRDHSVEHSSDADVPELEGMPVGSELDRVAHLEGPELEAELAALLTSTLRATRDVAEAHDGPGKDAARLAEQASDSCSAALAAL
jgi:hypothetical protein